MTYKKKSDMITTAKDMTLLLAEREKTRGSGVHIMPTAWAMPFFHINGTVLFCFHFTGIKNKGAVFQ